MNSKLQSLEKIVNSELSSKIKNSLIENNEFLIDLPSLLNNEQKSNNNEL